MDPIFSRKRHHPTTLLLICSLLALIPALAGCGKKGPPVAPRTIPLPVVADLSQAVKDGVVTLTWSAPAAGGVAGFHLLRAKIPIAEADCEDCPYVFERIADIPLESPSAALTFSEPLETGYRYLFKINVYTTAETVGEDSNTVDFVY